MGASPLTQTLHLNKIGSNVYGYWTDLLLGTKSLGKHKTVNNISTPSPITGLIRSTPDSW